ncbi:MAG: hypothetical protein SWO11_20050 [Thermodesulfobacteriota bacterium]|nr:hypothetical protein [Thermodesulfobacteriota bacterium]
MSERFSLKVDKTLFVKATLFFAIFYLFLGLSSIKVNGEILFEGNFDGHKDSSHRQKKSPEYLDNSYCVAYPPLQGYAGCEVSESSYANPVLHFCDIISGPKSGNTGGMVNNHGVIVTIWGNNLGSSQGASKIFFKDSTGNIHEAAYVYYWVNADGLSSGGPADLHTYHKMQEIAFSIPVAVVDGLGRIYATVNSVNSNKLDFTVRGGGIYFVKTTGNNSTGDGSWSTPWQTIDFISEGAGGTLDAGDIISVCNAVIETGGTGIKILGASTAPLALVAYPGASVEIIGLMNNIVTVANWYQSHGYWVFSKLFIDTEATGMNPFTDMRVVGVEITGPNSNVYGGSIAGSEANAEAVDGTCGGGKFYGLYIHNFGNDQTSEFHHTTYISNRDGLPNKAYEYGWCYLHDNKTVNGFHIYDQSPFGDWIGVIKIHDNVMVNQRGPAVNLMGGSGITVPLEIYGNIFINCGIGPDIDGWSVPKYAINLSDAVSSPVKIYNNLMYRYGDRSGCAVNKAFSGTVDY